MKMSLRVVKLKTAIMINIMFFIGGCLLTLSLINVQTFELVNSPSFVISPLKKYEKSSVKYVNIILTAPSNLEKRNVIRETWLRLPEMNYNSTQRDDVLSDFKHYFVIGTANIPTNQLLLLKKEQELHKDILFLPNLKDQYSSLTKKLLNTLQALDMTFPNLLYVLKCDDDSFVRIDIFLTEFKLRKEQFSKRTKKTQKEEMLYWGYFKGNAHVKLEGRWAEPDWVLCDRYLPYALGGGYVISGGILRYISKNADYLHLYNSEDVSMGVWTSPLAKINRIHDKRFDTEWASRGCDDSLIVRHKQSPNDMKELYSTLAKSKGVKLCKTISSVRPHYEYNWKVLPTSCCNWKK